MAHNHSHGGGGGPQLSPQAKTNMILVLIVFGIFSLLFYFEYPPPAKTYYVNYCRIFFSQLHD